MSSEESSGERGRIMRRRESTLDLFREAEEVKELSDGYAFRFRDRQEQLAAILALISIERECAPLLTFELQFAPQRGPLWLRIRGPEGVKAYIKGGLSAPRHLT
ncbi:hypothetical protein [Thermogemmatispora carboxidivorans]|uniref:hypothetical protein n=1 Tax=Thermogemmatispora carboxidivorans TaxID=1382306 RepID=UPI00069C45B3|nr:hypothetical protein [Thermogemmatispora carboxidivorans]